MTILPRSYGKKQPPLVFCKKGILRNFANFTGKHLCQNLFLSKEGLWHRCFPVNFAKFLRTPFLQNTSGRLHLKGGDNSQNFTPMIFKS